MKRTTIAVAVLLCVCMLVPSLSLAVCALGIGGDIIPYAISSDDMEQLRAVAGEMNETASSYSYNGYKTYTMADATLEWTVPNTTEGGTTCSAMQGMNTGTTYCYVAKRNSDDTYCDVTRINMDTGAKTVMDYYSSTSATSSSACNSLGHANELSVVGIGGVNYMFVATLWTTKAITRLKIDGTKLMLTGYFDLVNTSGTSLTASAIRHIKTSGGYLYFLIKRGNSFYTCRIAENATGGSASSPTDVTIYKIFVLDTRNAMFASSNSAASTMSGIDDWTNQGFGYNKTEKVLYVPIWDDGTPSRNVIITYNLSSVIDTWLDATSNLSNTVFPTKTSFMMQDTSVSQFEMESVSFRTGQGTTGDLKLYFNINCSTTSKEGVYSCTYTTGSGDFTPINEGKVVYTVKYNANGGSGSMSATNHINGIKAKLRNNAFTKSGYTFAGWYLTRKSDGKALYVTEAGNKSWYVKGSQPKGAVLALYSNQQSVSALSSVEGDTVTCTAQWTPNATGTTTFYVQYDANGGSGSMADTTVVYGTGANLRTNTFTRSGYVFTGWTAYRRNKAQWCYKDTTALGDMWLAAADDKAGYIRKTYKDGAFVSKTTSVDADIVTLYAAWSRVTGGVFPTSIVQGNDFTLGGSVASTTDLYSAELRVKNAAGTVVASYSANPFADSFDISTANSAINFASLAAGNYTCEVRVGTVDGSSPNMTTVHSSSFEVIVPSLTLKSDTVYAMGENLTGVDLLADVASVCAQFTNADVRVSDMKGNVLAEGALVGTGCTVACYNNGVITDSITVVVLGDIDGDAQLSASDYLSVQLDITGGAVLAGAKAKAADVSQSGSVDSVDYINMVARLTGSILDW